MYTLEELVSRDRRSLAEAVASFKFFNVERPPTEREIRECLRGKDRLDLAVELLSLSSVD